MRARQQSSARLLATLESRRHDDRGMAAGGDVLIFGFISIIFTVMVVINAWAAIDSALAVSAAAREGARTFVEADDGDTGEIASRSAMSDVMDQYGHPSTATHSVQIEGGAFVRCALVTATTSVEIDLLRVPYFGNFGSHTITATHSERIDPFRSGDFVGECA